MGNVVVDSSTLITLAGAGALDLLKLVPHRARTVSAVHRETVEVGVARGIADAAAIAAAFAQRVVAIQEPRRKDRLPGISLADSLVLHLAVELGAACVFTNDRTLFRKARQQGLVAGISAELVLDLHTEGRISQQRRDALLKEFVARGRYSEEFIQALLLGR